MSTMASRKKAWVVSGLLIGLMLFLAAALYVPDALAAKQIDKGSECDRSKYADTSLSDNSMSYFIMMCVQARTELFGAHMIFKLQQLIGPILVKVCSLAIVLLAIKVTLGGTGRKALGETMILMFKMCIVYYCATGDGVGTLTTHMQQFMQGSTEVVSIVFDSGMASLNELNPGVELCREESDIVRGLPEVAWRFDCLFGRIFGFNSGGLLRAATAGVLMAGTIFAPPFLAAICMAFISMLLLYLAAMFQVLLYVVTVYVSLALLFGVAPIVIPLWFFEPTKKITIVWFNNVIAYLMMPAILTAYLMMMQLIFLGVGGVKLYGEKSERIYSGLGLANCTRLEGEDPDEPKPGCFDVMAEFIDLPDSFTSGSGSAADVLRANVQEHVNALAASNKWSNLDAIIKEPRALLDNLKFVVIDTATKAQADISKTIDQTWQDIKIAGAKLAYQMTVKGKFMVPFIAVKSSVIMQIFALCVANIILLALMLSYMRRLITDVDKIVAKAGIVQPNISQVQGVERVVDHAMRSMNDVSRYGRYS